MQLLSKVAVVVNKFPLLNYSAGGCILKINGGSVSTTIKQSQNFCISPPPLTISHRLFTHLAAAPNRNGKTTASSSFSKMMCCRSSLLFSTFKTTPFASPKAVAKFHATDGLSPKSFTLVYKSDFQWYLIIAQTTVVLAIGAVIACLAAALLDTQIYRETKEEIVAQAQVRIMENEKVGRDEVRVATGFKEATGPEVVENLPSLADVISADLDFIAMFFVMLVLLGLSIFRLMTMLPVRIYVGKKNHCIGVYYGSLIPGRLVRQEFVAGTLVQQKSSFGTGNAYFKDGSGRSMMLFEHFFRRPADFNYLTGITKSFHFEDQDSDELSQLKRLGSFGSSSDSKK